MATKKKSPKAESVTRIEAAALVLKRLKGGASLEQIAERADVLYVDGGGRANLNEALFDVRRAIRCAAVLGFVVLGDDGKVRRASR